MDEERSTIVHRFATNPARDLLEPGVGGVGDDLGGDLDRLLARDVARRVEAVDADVGQRAAAGQGLLVPPLVGAALVLAVRRLDQPQRAELARAGQADQPRG